MGATHTYKAGGGKTAEEMSAEVESMLGGNKPDITIECSGVEDSIRFGIFSTKSGGCLVLVGLGKPEVRMPIVNAAVREGNIQIRELLPHSHSYGSQWEGGCEATHHTQVPIRRNPASLRDCQDWSWRCDQSHDQVLRSNTTVSRMRTHRKTNPSGHIVNVYFFSEIK